jgi:hypothetical protein
MDHIINKHKSKPQSKRYFTKSTEDAIVKYNNSLNHDEKSLIYERHIHWPFYKLTENIIHTFKFYYSDVENLEDLQHEIMVFLLDKIHLFNPDNGAKAYSYFGTIVKRWLINYNNVNYKNQINNIAINNLNDYSNIDSSDPLFILSHRVNQEIDSLVEDNFLETNKGNNKDLLNIFINEYINYCTENIYNIFPKENDAKVADAILELFRKREHIDLFNKKALYIFIREQIDVKTPKITRISNILNKIFKEKYLFYLENGYFSS